MRALLSFLTLALFVVPANAQSMGQPYSAVVKPGAGVQPGVCQDNIFTILYLGQSNAANTAGGTYARTKMGGTYWGGHCYHVFNGIYGATGDMQANCNRLADKLALSLGRPVLCAALAVGGAPISRFATGDLQQPLADKLAEMNAAGLPPNIILWEQGEAEVTWGTTESAYQTALTTVIDAIRDYTPAPIYLAKSTRCALTSSDPNEAVRGAIDNVLASRSDTHAGPDLDAYFVDPVTRRDGCHWNANSEPLHAQLWFDAINSTLAMH